MHDVAVDDPRAGPVDCPAEPAELIPGVTVRCTATATITQAEVDAGSIDNVATASALLPNGDPISSPADSTSTPTADDATLVLDKQAAGPIDGGAGGAPDGRIDPGDTIDYTITVRNTGVRTVTGLIVEDALVDPVCTATTLEPGASTSCTATYTITQTDVDARSVANTATARGRAGGTAVVSNADTATTPLASASGLLLDKRELTPIDVDGDARISAGDVVPYQIVLTNTGDVTLHNLVVDDPRAAADQQAVDCPTSELAPRDQIVCTTEIVIDQAEVEAGSVSNTATATALDTSGASVAAPPDTESTPLVRTGTLALDKRAGTPTDANADGRIDAGDTVPYTFVLTNTGTLILTDVTVADPRTAPVDCPVLSLDPGRSTTCTGSTTVTQADVDAGSVNNTATAEAVTATGDRVAAPADSTSTPTDTTTGLTLDKTAGSPVDVNGNGRVDAGDTISYSFLLTNVGTLTLSSLSVADPLTAAPTCPVTSLAPGAQTTCTADYVITAGDVETGSVTNTATAAAVRPDGQLVLTDPDSTVTPTQGRGVLQLVKTAGAPVDANDSGRLDAGDTITYRFVITDTGDRTLTGLVLTDPRIADEGRTIACPSTTLSAGASITCTAEYTLTQADLDAGSLTNVATVAGDDHGTAVSDQDGVTSPLPAEPGLSLDKTALPVVDADDDGRDDAGDTLRFRFLITNTGALTMTGITVDDPMLVDAGVAITCPRAASGAAWSVDRLPPGASITCLSAPYTITDADVARGRITNEAGVSGESFGGTGRLARAAGSVTLDLPPSPSSPGAPNPTGSGQPPSPGGQPPSDAGPNPGPIRVPGVPDGLGGLAATGSSMAAGLGLLVGFVLLLLGSRLLLRRRRDRSTNRTDDRSPDPDHEE